MATEQPKPNPTPPPAPKPAPAKPAAPPAPLAPQTPVKETTQTGGPTEPARTTTPVTNSTTGAPQAPAPVKPGDVTTAKTAAPQNVPPVQQSTTANQADALKAADAAQREQNLRSGQPAREMPSQAAANEAKAAGADTVKEQAKVEAGKAMASGATDVKQNREDVTTPAMIPDHKKPNNDGNRPTHEGVNPRHAGGIINQVTPPSVEQAGDFEKKLMEEKRLKDDKGQPLPAIPQDAHEIAATNPIRGASAPVTPANVVSNVAQALNTRVNVGTTPNTGVGLTKVEETPKVDTQGKLVAPANPAVAHNEIGPTGTSGIAGTGDSGITTGGQTPKNVEKDIVFTVLLADSRLKDMGFTHVVADNNSRQLVAAFASEADAVKYSDMING